MIDNEGDSKDEGESETLSEEIVPVPDINQVENEGPVPERSQEIHEVSMPCHMDYLLWTGTNDFESGALLKRLNETFTMGATGSEA